MTRTENLPLVPSFGVRSDDLLYNEKTKKFTYKLEQYDINLFVYIYVVW